MKLTTGLTLIFTVFKLLGVINWSWWLVFLPSIIGVIVFVFLVVLKVLLDDDDDWGY